MANKNIDTTNTTQTRLISVILVGLAVIIFGSTGLFGLDGTMYYVVMIVAGLVVAGAGGALLRMSVQN